MLFMVELLKSDPQPAGFLFVLPADLGESDMEGEDDRACWCA